MVPGSRVELPVHPVSIVVNSFAIYKPMPLPTFNTLKLRYNDTLNNVHFGLTYKSAGPFPTPIVYHRTNCRFNGLLRNGFFQVTYRRRHPQKRFSLCFNTCITDSQFSITGGAKIPGKIASVVPKLYQNTLMIWYRSAVLHKFHIFRTYFLSGGLACKLLMVCYALISYYVLST